MELAGQGRASQARTGRARLTRRLRLATAEYAQRRRFATAFAMGAALLLGSHAMMGRNGIVAYQGKRAEDRALARQIGQMQQENGRLQQHVDHLKSDPNAIEYEAHVRLRYAKPGQVIVLNDDKPASAAEAVRK